MKNTPWQQITLGQIYRATINTLERWGTAIRHKAESLVQTTIEPAWEAVKAFGDDPTPLLPPAKLQLMPAKEQCKPKTQNPLLLTPTLEQSPQNPYWWLPFLQPSFIPAPDIEKPDKKTKNPKKRSSQLRQEAIAQTPLPFDYTFNCRRISDLRRRRTVFGLLYVAWINKKLRKYHELKKFVKQHTGQECSGSMIAAFKRLISSGKIYQTTH